jgi:hypothetical protein
VHNIYKVTFIIFSLLYIPRSLCETINPAPIYNINCNPTITPQIELHPQIIVTNSSASSITIGDITLQCIQKIKNTATPENYNLLKNYITNALWNYRYQIAGATALGTYTVLSAILFTDYYQMLQNTTWVRWKQNCSFECLCTMPQKDLTHELLCAINQQYYHKDKPTDFAHPLMMFIYAVDAEIKTCKRYLAIASAIKKLRLIKIFPTNDTKINEVTQLLERTLFIKHLFLSWLAEYNIANN